MKELVQESRMDKREDGSYAIHMGEVLIWPPLLVAFVAIFFPVGGEIGAIIILALFLASVLAILYWPDPPAWGAIDLKITLWIPGRPPLFRRPNLLVEEKLRERLS